MNPIVDIIVGIIPQLSDKELEILNDKFLFEIWDRQSGNAFHEIEAANYIENLRSTDEREFK